jgi:type 1 fimbria pilin
VRNTVQVFVTALWLSAGAAILAAQTKTFSGTLVDSDCKADDASKKCEVTSTSNAFGIQMPDGKYLKFDDHGNANVRVALHRRKAKVRDINRAGTIRVTATGTADGNTIKADSVELY